MNQIPTLNSTSQAQEQSQQKQGRQIKSFPQRETNAYILDMLEQLEGLASQAKLTDLAFMINLAKNCSRQFE